ncbi:hypothetical protein WCD74_27130 [Actinomycetospora sp. OC33-EN08]|uniref:Uncharacterized protein n=1 Tax=Actinomycetospora aurantiaca TaxID=3129233 RepID=A0ABU8MY00_9PSEU
MDRADRKGPVARDAYRVRAVDRGADTLDFTGVGPGRAAHARPRSPLSTVARGLGVALVMFVLALLLVTGLEAVLGSPLSGGAAGHTTLGDVLHAPR